MRVRVGSLVGNVLLTLGLGTGLLWLVGLIPAGVARWLFPAAVLAGLVAGAVADSRARRTRVRHASEE